MSSIQPPTTLLILVLVIAGVLMVQKTGINSKKVTVNKSMTSSKTQSPSATAVPTSTPLPSKSPTASPSQISNTGSSSVNINISQESSDGNANKSNINIGNFVYPNSTSLGSGVYESNDSPNIITDWYKEKIKSLGMSTTSFVQTSANDNVLNKLVGSDGKGEIRVEISRPADNSKTTIKLNP
ncbi:hypothetical protein HYS97_02725 [Candidatus Daviesbacteria bacterium]|nr:hypothetical protein [Candidatus Daviesbacteria bacterium]